MMNGIFTIFKRDLQRIFSNPIALIIITALLFLPSLYAWFNIKSSWDPYGNTKGIKIAIVNLDEGTQIEEKSINIGDSIVESLKSNTSLGWIFTNEQDAQNGILTGDYYASITIPTNFTQNLFTVLTTEIKKPELIYTVNEKINAIAPKITSKGATTLQSTVSEQFIQLASETIFTLFNQLGFEIEKNLPDINKFVTTIIQLDNDFPATKEIVNKALTIATDSEVVIENLSKKVTEFKNLNTNLIEIGEQTNLFIKRFQTILNDFFPLLKDQLGFIQKSSLYVKEVADSLLNLNGNPEGLTESLNLVEKRLNSISILATNIRLTFESLNNFQPSQALQSKIEQLNTLEKNIQGVLQVINDIQGKIESGESIPPSLLGNLQAQAERLHTFSSNLLNNMDSIQDGLNTFLTNGDRISQDVKGFLEELNALSPKIQDVLKKIQDASKASAEQLLKLQKDLPSIEEKLKNLAQKLQKMNPTELSNFISLLKNDVQKEKDFFAHPVELKENKLYPIPNYGSAMSPFFTTLSLWVGGLILVSILSVHLHEDWRTFEIYFGRLLLFLVIACIQGLIVTLGDIYILKAYVVHPFLFVLFGGGIACIFTLMIYTLVSVFGNVGKALAIVLLVLQLSASGGTFPIQVTPPFFQAINPFLPFTYAISIMRECVGGIVLPIIYKDIFYLLIYVVLFLLLGIGLKKPFTQVTKNFLHKAKKSGIFE